MLLYINPLTILRFLPSPVLLPPLLTVLLGQGPTLERYLSLVLVPLPSGSFVRVLLGQAPSPLEPTSFSPIATLLPPGGSPFYPR